MYKILEKKELAPSILDLYVIEAPRVAAKAKAGQFIILRIDEQGERIPLTIADFDREKGTITLVAQRAGKTTTQLGHLKAGDYLADFVGPLGEPTHIEKYGRVVTVGGGVGVAPTHPIARAMKEAGNEVISIIGARTKELLFWEDEMRKVCTRLLVTTDDGSYVRKGFVTDVLKEVMDEKKPDLVVAIGPQPMMRAVCNLTREYGVKTIVSLNSIMVDGTGMCGCCRVTVGGKTKFVCVDGPDFDGHEVDFAELARRSAIYRQQEKESLDRYTHRCQCHGGEH